jgi:hypothetical protein
VQGHAPHQAVILTRTWKAASWGALCAGSLNTCWLAWPGHARKALAIVHRNAQDCQQEEQERSCRGAVSCAPAPPPSALGSVQW